MGMRIDSHPDLSNLPEDEYEGRQETTPITIPLDFFAELCSIATIDDPAWSTPGTTGVLSVELLQPAEVTWVIPIQYPWQSGTNRPPPDPETGVYRPFAQLAMGQRYRGWQARAVMVTDAPLKYSLELTYVEYPESRRIDDWRRRFA